MIEKNKILTKIEREIYNECSLVLSNIEIEVESSEYGACKFMLNENTIICRSAKITPKKVGQFVTFWKRNKEGKTEPFNEKDKIDFYVINVKSENSFGQFVFPKSELINKGILSTEKKDGKRGFRVYPEWDIPENKQATKTQKWQLEYFFRIEKGMNFGKVKELYTKK